MDKASFQHPDIIAVFGERPRCILSGVQSPVDLTHIMGRGGKHNRDIHGSLLNCAPLSRDIHSWGLRDHPLMRVLLLHEVYEKVLNTIRDGRYEMHDNDKQFLEMYDNYYQFNWSELWSDT